MHILFTINGMQHGNSNLGKGTGATRCRQHARRNSRHNEVSFFSNGEFLILFCIFTRYFFHFHKVKKVYEDSLDSIPSPFKSWAGKFALCVKAKHCWVLSTN
jgi:hypothetical protein